MDPLGGLILQRVCPFAQLRTGPWRSYGSSFQLYRTGVLVPTSSKKLDHGGFDGSLSSRTRQVRSQP